MVKVIEISNTMLYDVKSLVKSIIVLKYQWF